MATWYHCEKNNEHNISMEALSNKKKQLFLKVLRSESISVE